jgi:copper chaperone CopZ
MSRRGAEFQHRTSVFEGAYRAWSHLGRLDPIELETKPVSELDPTLYNSNNLPSTVDVETGRDYPYEPLPRSGLAHPFVKAVLTPWLGPDVDEDGVKLGLETLRTWWQHRRKGQNTSAMKALGSDKMRTAVDEYTRHFFQIAHCLILSDNEQPPKGLQMRLKDSGRRNLIKPTNTTDDSCPNWKSIVESTNDISTSQQIDMKGKCIPGKLNLPDVLEGINHKALQMAHRGVKSTNATEAILQKSTFGDPSKFPVVYQSKNGDLNIALVVNGMICAHCIKIVETVLKGCTGQRSPIDGLLDAAADQEFDGVLIKIDKAINARRIAFESARNLSLVGYKAEAVHFVMDESIDTIKNRQVKLQQLLSACEHFGSTSPIIFDWTIPCSCPDSGVYRNKCQRYALTVMIPQYTYVFFLPTHFFTFILDIHRCYQKYYKVSIFENKK